MAAPLLRDSWGGVIAVKPGFGACPQQPIIETRSYASPILLAPKNEPRGDKGISVLCAGWPIASGTARSLVGFGWYHQGNGTSVSKVEPQPS
jgi:hypothetical protein